MQELDESNDLHRRSYINYTENLGKLFTGFKDRIANLQNEFKKRFEEQMHVAGEFKVQYEGANEKLENHLKLIIYQLGQILRENIMLKKSEHKNRMDSEGLSVRFGGSGGKGCPRGVDTPSSQKKLNFSRPKLSLINTPVSPPPSNVWLRPHLL